MEFKKVTVALEKKNTILYQSSLHTVTKIIRACLENNNNNNNNINFKP